MLDYPIVYVRGYAGTQGDVEETVDDPLYGFNAGSTHIRLDQEGQADFFMFVSPFARLFKDFGYADVIDGALQRIDQTWPTPRKTIWIYRYYDPTSNTFDRPGGRRLSIEEAAAGLREFIASVKKETTAEKVHLVAHSMGGLVCRSLLQKLYPENNERGADHVHKLFTYGTPHGGIHLDLGAGLIEKVRDSLGVNNSDDFGRRRMYEYLTPAAQLKTEVPDDFDPTVIPPDAFDRERVFCIVGTNASDYAVAGGLSRVAVGPQSDGLVQISSAAVEGAPRAYIHRSHSGRYGMVNSEEGYQNLQRFLFGDVKVGTTLCNFNLDFKPDPGDDEGTTVTYMIETHVAIRGLPILMHERTLSHYCADALSESKHQEQMKSGGLPLFTNFLLSIRAQAGTMRYMLRIAIFKQKYRKGFLLMRDHLERLPLWSDYLIAELRRPTPAQRGELRYVPHYTWASLSSEPNLEMSIPDDQAGAELDLIVPLPDGKAREVLGTSAVITFHTFDWD